MAKNIKVIKENKTGRNEKFIKQNGEEMTRAQFVKEIESGKQPDYHIRNINKLKTPVSNPDKKEGNNLG